MTTPPALHCPKCNQPLAVRAAPGQLLQCPNCRTTFPAPARTTGSHPPPQVAAVAPTTTAYTPPTYRRANRFSGVALASLSFALLYFLTLGILAFSLSFVLVYALPALALITIILGVVAIVKTARRTVRGRALAITAITLGCLQLAFAALVIPFAHRSAEEAENRVRCAAHLRQLGTALMLYSHEHRGTLPDRLEDLPLTEDVTAQDFICPSSSDTPAAGSKDQLANNLQSPGHQSYIYAGKGKTYASAFGTVLIYESLAHHGEGFNVLLGDGRAIYLQGPVARKISAELQSGKNPPPSLNPDRSSL